MAISYYVGISGSGKTYNAVEDAVNNLALESPRRIVSNVRDLNKDDSISDYLGKEISSLVVLQDNEFFKDHLNYYHPKHRPDAPIQPGDFLIIDEILQIFPSRIKLHPEILEYFMMHRHYNRESDGATTEIILMSQAWGHLHTHLQGNLATTVEFKKLKGLKLFNRYRIRIFEGGQNPKLKTNDPLNIKLKKYNSKFWDFYSSSTSKLYSDNGVGKSGNLLTPLNILVFLAAIFFIYYGISYLYNFFNKSPSKTVSNMSEAVLNQTAPVSKDPLGLTSKYSYVGVFMNNNQPVYMFEKDKTIIYTSISDFKTVQNFGFYQVFELKDGSKISTQKKVFMNENNQDAYSNVPAANPPL